MAAVMVDKADVYPVDLGTGPAIAIGNALLIRVAWRGTNFDNPEKALAFSVSARRDGGPPSMWLVLTPTHIQLTGEDGFTALRGDVKLELSQGWSGNTRIRVSGLPKKKVELYEAPLGVPGVKPFPESLSSFEFNRLGFARDAEWETWVKGAINSFDDTYRRALTIVEPLLAKYTRVAEQETAQRSIDAGFSAALQFYRSASPKPTPPESVHRLQIQAEAAVDDKSFAEAAGLYSQALAIAPWWPDGYFNRAVISAELKDYAGAISDMNRYLELMPDARDARQARDNIYKWERALNASPR
jgi:tetratricopeptide (TPR) repeat protein